MGDSGTAETESSWKDVTEATCELADAYEALYSRRRNLGREGLAVQGL